MKIKLQINTPTKQATSAMNQFMFFFKIFSRTKISSWVNKEDSIIYIEVEGNPKQISDIMKRVAYMDVLPQMMLQNKVTKKAIKIRFPECTDEDLIKLDKMFKQNHKITVLKEASAQEMLEDGKTRWQKIKETFTNLFKDERC